MWWVEFASLLEGKADMPSLGLYMPEADVQGRWSVHMVTRRKGAGPRIGAGMACSGCIDDRAKEDATV